MIRRAEHLNALLVHVLDAQFPANERNGNLDGLGVGHVLILAARALCIAAHPYLANGFRIRFCAIELVGISISIHFVEALAADRLQAVIPNRVDAVSYIPTYVLFLGHTADKQFRSLLIPAIGKGSKQNSNYLRTVGQINLGGFTLAPTHACCVEVISTRQVLAYFSGEHFVDVCIRHNRIPLIEQLYNRRI